MIWWHLIFLGMFLHVSSLRSTKSRDELLQLLLGAELVAVAALLLAAVHGPSLACVGATHGAKACHMKAY